MRQLDNIDWISNLYRLGQATPDDAMHIYQVLLEHIVAGFEGKSGTLAIMDKQVLTIVAGIDLPPGVIGRQIQMNTGVMGWVAHHQEPLLLAGDIASDARFTLPPKREAIRVPSSAICWPVLVDDKLIGTLSVNRAAGMPDFVHDDLARGTTMLNLVGIVLANIHLRLKERNQIAELKQVQAQLLQSEKMASIGSMAAGVAHEINNPIGYVFSNLGTLDRYVSDLLSILDDYALLEKQCPADSPELASLAQHKQEKDLAFLREDIAALMNESKDGISRVKKIVQDLKDFSHKSSDEEDWQVTDLHKCLDSTINLVWNELKYKCEMKREFGTLPEVECLPSQLNQVLMNVLVNAGHAIETKGVVTVRTGIQADFAWISISDTGKGISPENLTRIFDPFFTTKPVGQGTGLGLALSYGIMQKHNGRIEVESEVGKGTTFRLCIPLHHAEQAKAA
jgi:two-component system NtrC family sensor kinase